MGTTSVNGKVHAIAMALAPPAEPFDESGSSELIASPNYLIYLPTSIVPRAVQHGNGVRQQFSNRVERFDGASWAARQINNDGAAANRGHTARKDGALGILAAFSAHMFGKARN